MSIPSDLGRAQAIFRWHPFAFRPPSSRIPICLLLICFRTLTPTLPMSEPVSRKNGDASSTSAGPAFRVNSDLVATTSAPIPTAGAWAATYKGEHGPLIKLTQVRPASCLAVSQGQPHLTAKERLRTPLPGRAQHTAQCGLLAAPSRSKLGSCKHWLWGSARRGRPAGCAGERRLPDIRD